MSYSIEYNKKKKCIYVAVEGVLELALFERMASEIAKIIKDRDCGKIINDLRNAVPPESSADIYFMPERALNAGVSRAIKRALVVSGSVEDYKFLRTVFVNQGNVVRLFDSIDDAEQWLFKKADS